MQAVGERPLRPQREAVVDSNRRPKRGVWLMPPYCGYGTSNDAQPHGRRAHRPVVILPKNGLGTRLLSCVPMERYCGKVALRLKLFQMCSPRLPM